MERMAEYMIPHHYMLIDEIPLSANGKGQREKLPAIRTFSVDRSRSFSFDTRRLSYQASNHFEQVLLEIVLKEQLLGQQV